MFTPPYRHGVIIVEFHEAITQINYFVYWKVKRVVKWLNLIMLCTLAKKLDDMSRFLLPKNLTGRSSFPLNSTQFPWQLFKSLYAQLRGQLWEHKAHKGTIKWKFTSKCKLRSLLGITRPSPFRSRDTKSCAKVALFTQHNVKHERIMRSKFHRLHDNLLQLAPLQCNL